MFLSLTLSISLLEIGYRVIYERPKIEKPKDDWAIVPERTWIEYHPSLGWFHQKNKTSNLEAKNYSVQVHTNSQGFRGQKEYSLQKDPLIPRILILGDSFFFGWGVNDEETVAAKLELNNMEAINLAVPGYGINQILMSYREIGRKFNPDLVLISVFPDDFHRATESFSDSGYAKPYFSLEPGGILKLHNIPTPKPFEMTTGQYPEVIQHKPIEKILLHSSVYKTLRRGFQKIGKQMGWIDSNSTDEWILGKAILTQLIMEIRKDGAIPILIFVPARWTIGNEQESFRKSFARLSKSLQVDLIDPTEEFTQAIKTSKLEDYYIQDDWHWTAQGHQLLADLLSDYLKEHKFL